MEILGLLLQVISACILLLAHLNKGVRPCPVFREHNDSPQHDGVYGLTKQNLPTLESNSIEATLSRKVNDSSSVKYYASHYSYRNPNASYYGLHATTDVYGHELKRGQVSRTAILVSHRRDGNGSSYDSVIAGWHIYPEKYGDSHPHFFTYWMKYEDEKAGCFNMDCPGFIKANEAEVTPGDLIHPVSNVKYGHLENVTLRVLKDGPSGDWWVYYGFNSVPKAVGYYPRSLFTYIGEKANDFAFGAFVYAERVLPTPPMGSGVLPGEGKGRAASFNDLRIIDFNGSSDPITIDLPIYLDDKKCYFIAPIVKAQSFYGGRGGCVP